MKIIFGLVSLFIGGIILRDSIINNKKLLEEFREMESDLGISYYKGWIAGVGFVILGVLLLLNHF